MFILDSWIETKVPCIRVLCQKTGQVLLEFRGDEVQQLFDQQVVASDDLLLRDQSIENEVIRALFYHSSGFIDTEAMHKYKVPHMDDIHQYRYASSFKHIKNIISIKLSHIRLKLMANTYNRNDYLRQFITY